MIKRMGVVAVFLVGCAVGGASSQLIVPKASAQQAATLTKWEYHCDMRVDGDDVTARANQLGAQGWETSGADLGSNYSNLCFKRPKR